MNIFSLFLITAFLFFVSLKKPLWGFSCFMILSLVMVFIKTLIPNIPIGIFRDVLMLSMVGGIFLSRHFSPAILLEDLLVLIFILWGMLGVMNPKVLEMLVSLNAVRGFILPALLYFVSRSMERNDKYPDLLIKIFLIYGLVNIITVFIQMYYPDTAMDGLYENIYIESGYAPKFGLLGARGWHSLGLLMAIIITVLYFYLRQLQGPWYWIGLLIFPGALFVLIQAYARTPLVSGILGIIIVSVIAGRKFQVIGVIITAGISLYILSLIVEPTVAKHYLTLSAPFQTNSWTGRLEIWNDLIKIMSDNPFGLGPGATGGSSLSTPTAFYYGAKTADSIYLKIIFEHGIIGLLLFIIFCISILNRSCRAIINNVKRKSPRLHLLMTYSGGFVVLLISGVSVAMMEMFPASFIFWLIAGVLVNSKYRNTNLIIDKQITQ